MAPDVKEAVSIPEPISTSEDKPTRPPQTPRRAAAVKRPTGSTPRRKVSGQNVQKTPKSTPAAGTTPKSAPARGASKSKKQEPTLLGDFLLGRPSPARVQTQRRKSLDMVRAEMKVAVVNKVQQPGGVKDRVKQWQKASAAAATAPEPEYPATEPEEELPEDMNDADEAERMRIRRRESKATVKRKPPEKDAEPPDEQKDEPTDKRKPAEKRNAESPRTPKKRVVSDDHWMHKKSKKKTPPRKSPVHVDKSTGTTKLPKDFVQKNNQNPPLSTKIGDWAKNVEDLPLRERRSRHTSREVFGEENIRDPKTRASSGEDNDRGTRVSSTKANSSPNAPRNTLTRSNADDDGIRITPSKDSDDGIRVTPVRPSTKEKARTSSGQYEKSWPATGTRGKSFSQRNKPSQPESLKHRDHWNDQVDVPDTPTHGNRTKYHRSESPESLAEVPVGYSAFSVLDLPLGADAHTTRRPQHKPARNPSFKSVPNVLKKVFNGALEMAHDTVEPPRIGLNQPPSIESWLNGTMDPFVDRESPSELAKPTAKEGTVDVQRDDSPTNESRYENGHYHGGTNYSTKSEAKTYQSAHVENSPGKSEVYSASNENTPEQTTPPSANLGLKRSPATRNSSSPALTRRIPLRERLAEAFKGESVTVRGSTSPNDRDQLPSKRRIESEPLPAQRGDKEASNEPTKQSPNATSRMSSRTLPSLPEHGLPLPPVLHDMPLRSRKEPPMTGMHRLSTIASVETFKSGASLTETSIGSLTETSSCISDTTITQNTAGTGETSHTSYTEATESSISRGMSNKSTKSNKSGLKRRLTKHADLMSVLSLPDVGPERCKSTRSARSIRTTRSRLESATIEDLLQEVANDEVKYMRELQTLVDGVIPVLLTCVLSKSESAIAAGLFNTSTTSDPESVVTKPIVDMGVALERLKSLHKRIPLQDPHQLMTWASSAHKVYKDYLAAWRMGFKDVVVNLAPASHEPLEGVPRNAAGDVVNADGDRVDVAFLLKRPLVRIKHLAKITKGVNMIMPTEETQRLRDIYDDLLVQTRRRAKEEEARQEDLAANNTDTSRARHPGTLAPAEEVSVDRTRQVYMKDFFSFDLQHSTGQRIDCRVELLLRDKPKDKQDPGDVLICEVDTNSRWLLLPPIDLDHISARQSYNRAELVVLIRGGTGTDTWEELITLTADDDETALEWIDALGKTPIPPPLRSAQQLASALARQPSVLSLKASHVNMGSNLSCLSDVEIPIGERKRQPTTSSHLSEQSTMSLKDRIKANTVLRDHVTNNHNHKARPNSKHQMSGGLGEDVEKRPNPSRYHKKLDPALKSPASPLSTEELSDKTLMSRHSPMVQDDDHRDSASPVQSRSPSTVPSPELPQIPKRRKQSRAVASEDMKSTPLKEDMRPQLTPAKRDRSPPHTPTRDEQPPTPPAHKSSSPPLPAKKTPILHSIAQKFKNRRSSSPLKHEYQPSEASETSDSEVSDDYSDSYTDSSDDEELEAPEISPLAAGAPIYEKATPPGSLYSLPNGNNSLAPSNSASQGPFIQAPMAPSMPKTRIVASISAWSDKGRWESLHPEDCSIAIGPGVIEAFTLSTNHATGTGRSELTAVTDEASERPLVALDLTPLVPLRQSTVVDIEIRSPPLPRSIFKWSGSVRFRTHTVDDCNKLYAALHRARLDNPVFKRLEQERLVNSYGGQTYHEAQGEKRRLSFFGRKKSYRATERAPSVSTSDNQSSNSFTSAFVKRITSGGSFNIAKSTVGTHQGGVGRPSPATSLYTDSTSGYTPPRTPMSDSMAESSMTKIMARGTRDIKVRCYKLVTMSSWGLDISARLTVEDPPRGMRQATTLYTGIEKRVIVTAKAARTKDDKLRKTEGSSSHETSRSGSRRASIAGQAHSRRISLNGLLGQDDDNQTEPRMYTVLDTVIGGQCVLRYGRTGIAINVWEPLTGPNGEIGMAAAVGGVSGRTRKWMLSFNSQEEMRWIYAVLGGR